MLWSPTRTAPLLLSLASLPLATAAEGSRLVGQGPTQLGTTGAGAASALDATWLSLNAATLVNVGQRADVSVETIYAQVELEPQGLLANPNAGRMEDEVWVFAPHLFYTHPIDDDRTVGLGLYTVSGLHVDWPESRSLPGASGNYDTESTVTNTRASVAWSQRLDTSTSLGIAFNLNYSELNTNIATATGAETEGDNQVDRALGAGLQLALHHRSNDWAIGLVYTTRQWMQSFEDYDDVLIGPLDMPAVTQLGVAWQATDDLELLFDIRHIDWASVDAIGNETQGFGWESQIITKLGLRYQATDDVLILAGLSYGASQIDDEDAYLNGLSVLTHDWHIAAGATWDINAAFQLQGSLMYAPANEVTDNGGTFGAFTEGTAIAIDVWSFGTGLGYQF